MKKHLVAFKLSVKNLLTSEMFLMENFLSRKRMFQ